jgi:hypothetical protein
MFFTWAGLHISVQEPLRRRKNSSYSQLKIYGFSFPFDFFFDKIPYGVEDYYFDRKKQN